LKAETRREKGPVTELPVLGHRCERGGGTVVRREHAVAAAAKPSKKAELTRAVAQAADGAPILASRVEEHDPLRRAVGDGDAAVSEQHGAHHAR
jgi:hypothetical protein